jgi:L-ascorbate metabolism protein UlaG (beta-lactamase superfamily)
VLTLRRHPTINFDEMDLAAARRLEPTTVKGKVRPLERGHAENIGIEGRYFGNVGDVDGDVMYRTEIHDEPSHSISKQTAPNSVAYTVCSKQRSPARRSHLRQTWHMTSPSTLDWYGCATFRLKTADLTIFLDAYIDRVPSAAGTGLTADDIDECDWIVVGHSHFDHLWGAERIAKNTGATIICSYESVRVMEQAGVPTDQLICVAGGETIELGNGVKVSVYPSQHSCVWSHSQMGQPDQVCIGELGVTWHEQQERMADLMRYLQEETAPEVVEHIVAGAPGHSERGDGGALVFLFETPDGSLFFQDTSGHWSGVLRDIRPDVAILGAAGRGNIDGEPVQGSLAQFVARQADLLRPKKVILGHHDDWLPGFSIPTDTAPIREELGRVVPTTSMIEMGYLESMAIFD